MEIVMTRPAWMHQEVLCSVVEQKGTRLTKVTNKLFQDKLNERCRLSLWICMLSSTLRQQKYHLPELMMAAPLRIHCALSPWYLLVLLPSCDNNSSSVPHTSSQSLATFPSDPMLPFPGCKLTWGCIAVGVLKLRTYANWLNNACMLNDEVAGQTEQISYLAIFSLRIQQKPMIFMKLVET